jgi:hypothetical protein
MSYPRYKNDHVDDGTPIRGGGKTCPNCHSKNFIETLSMEKCNDCGLQCDYWGGGSNDVYDRYLANKHAAEECEEQEDDENNWKY